MGNNLRIGSEISKEQAMSLRKGSHVIVQARLKDYKVNTSGYLRISLDKVKLIPIKYSRKNSIAP